MDIFKENTQFLKLEQQCICNDALAKLINIDSQTLYRKKYQNWYKENGKFYYVKTLNSKEILNYLLCEKIATTIFNLQAPEFLLAKIPFYISTALTIHYKIGLASLNFRKPEKTYFYANQDYFPFCNPKEAFLFLEQFFSILNNDLYQKLVDDLLNLITFHIYTGMRDLIDCNLLFEKVKDGFLLATLYDFDFCFENGIIEKYHYKSSICEFDLPSKDLANFLEKYPEFSSILLKIENIDMSKILNEIANEKNLFINDFYKKYYLKQDEIKKDFIRSIHL